MAQNQLLISGLVSFFCGVFLLGLSGMVFRLRAFRNKPAWDGLTRPLLLLSLPFLLVGLVLIYWFYPK